MSGNSSKLCEKNFSKKKKKACKTKGKGDASTLYICRDCSKQTMNPGKICEPERIEPVFVCKKCGSPSVIKKGLCKPRAFE